MSFVNDFLIESLHTVHSTVVERFGIAATFKPQAGGILEIRGVFLKNPVVEDLLPKHGAPNIRFFVRYVDINPHPQQGDQLIINGNGYNVSDVDVDIAGGAVLVLKKKST